MGSAVDQLEATSPPLFEAVASRPDGLRASGALPNSASVQLEGIWKAFGSTQVLSGINLHVSPGEFVTLLGPSGSGKTSILMLIAGFVSPDQGHLFVGGQDVTRLPPGRQRNVGVVFQNYALFPHMTVAKNIAFPLIVRRVPRREIAIRVRRLLELVHLHGLSQRRPAQLSGGQQQRVALARALIFEPSVLLMDEPLGALDVQLKQELQWEIRRLQKAIGATVIYVTHDQNEALLLSDRVALLRNGRIEQFGKPQDLYRAPCSVFAANFMGPANLLPGRYEAGPSGGLRIVGSRLLLSVIKEPTEEAGTSCEYVGLLRPEALSIGSGESSYDQNACIHSGAVAEVCGIVQDVVFVGQGIRYVVASECLPMPLVVYQLARAGQPNLVPGSRAQVRWHASDLHLISKGPVA